MLYKMLQKCCESWNMRHILSEKSFLNKSELKDTPLFIVRQPPSVVICRDTILITLSYRLSFVPSFSTCSSPSVWHLIYLQCIDLRTRVRDAPYSSLKIIPMFIERLVKLTQTLLPHLRYHLPVQHLARNAFKISRQVIWMIYIFPNLHIALVSLLM